MARIPPECQSIQDEIEGIQATIRGLQEELGSAPPAQKPAIIEMIRQEREKEGDAERRLNRCIANASTYFDIVGVEYTQAVQYFDFNGQGSGHARDNSVPLVARKQLIIRVYVARQEHDPPFPTTVSGTLSYGKVGGSNFPDLSAIASIPARASNDIDRGTASHTLNFRIPAAHCVGNLRFTLALFDPATPGFESTHQLNPRSFRDVPMLRVHGVLIRYTGNGLDLPAPSGQDLIDSLEYLNLTYPISGVQYTGCDTVEFDGDLTAATRCGDAWRQLLNMLSNLRDASGTDDIFVGLLPSATPTNMFSGCGREGVCAGTGDPTLMAHEVGHALGRGHAPCGNPNNPDSDYPDYDGYPSASIGEFGVDTFGLAIKDPTSTYDFMSYCGAKWISPYTYTGVMNRIATLAAARDVDGAEVGEHVRERLVLNVRVHRTGKVELFPSYHLKTSAFPSQHGLAGRFSCELLGANEQVLRTHRFHHADPYQHPDDDWVDFHEVVTWHPETRAIAVIRDGERLDTIAVAPDAPTVRVTPQPAVSAARRPELMRINWEVETREALGRAGLATYVLRYSHDGGKTWRAVAADLTETSSVVNTNLLPGGEHCIFQVVASNGIRTTSVETEPFRVERKARQAYLLSPKPNATSREGEPVVLRGGGFSPDTHTTQFEEVAWSSDRDGRLGVGYEVVTQALSAGTHKLTMRVPDGLGGEASASASIDVAPRG